MDQDPDQSEKDFLRYLAQTSSTPYGIHIESAEGCFIRDKLGREYLDLVGGIAVANIGHRHPKVLEAIAAQSGKYLHAMVYGEYIQDVQVSLGRKLADLLPEKLNCTYLVNSGTEANETALKLAKRHTGRYRLIACRNSYHGSTHGSLSVSGNEEKKMAFLPLLPEIRFIGFNRMEDLRMIDAQAAAVILEPVQGDAGVRIGDGEYLRELRRKCDESGTLLIFDEIQTGMGRTGKMFAFEHSGVIPDILTLAKAFGGGLPVGAMISDREIMKDFSHGPALGHITTFGGNPLSCAAANAVLTVLSEEDLIIKAEVKGRLFKTLLKHPEITHIRQIGLMLAVDLRSEEKVNRLVKRCLGNGVIIYRFLSHPNSFRLSPPLTISEDEIRTGVEKILHCLKDL